MENKGYVVSYVGLSTEYDANGYCECSFHSTLGEAKAKLQELRSNEIENLKDEGRKFEVLEDEDDDCRISWCGGDEQVRIQIHKV